jgi:hypothetical protein
MTRKVLFNGIEISQTKYDRTTLSIFDYLEKIKNLLEKGLKKEDKIAQFSVKVDFSPNTSPKHKIYANGSTTSKTKEKISSLLKKNANNDFSPVSGSAKVNFMVQDRK